MKLCSNDQCRQKLGETVTICPFCGQQLEASIFDQVGDYRIIDMVKESDNEIHYCALKESTGQKVMLRKYTQEAPFAGKDAAALDLTLKEISAFSENRLIQHLEIGQAPDGQWYRVSEWIDAKSWGDLAASGFFRSPKKRKEWILLFIEMAKSLKVLHDHGRIMPHLCLNDLVLYETEGRLKVKLDYKLSPVPVQLDQIPDSLKHLRDHPDFTLKRALGQRTDIWTLGRLIVELLVGTDEIGECQKIMDDIYHRFEPVVLHRKLSSVLRAMVDDDSDKRISSMDRVIEDLEKIGDDEIARWDKFARDPLKAGKAGRTLFKRAVAAVCAIIVVAAALYGYGHYRNSRKQVSVLESIKMRLEGGDSGLMNAQTVHNLSTVLASIKDKPPEERIAFLTQYYRRSVAFVLVSYYLELDGKRIPAGWGTGTAFLVSSDGYLITNRHVACPWLEQDRLAEIFKEAREKGKEPGFGYDLYLWFDGDEAFRPVAGIGSKEISDIFRLSNAWRMRGNGKKKVEIIGVMSKPQDLVDLIGSLQDDAAILKVSPLPADAVPIPIKFKGQGPDVMKGQSVFALGYPHGRKSIMGTQAVSRCTNGTISRVFDKAYSTNADLHPGNSGGPVIDLDGFAVGIASAIFVSDAGTKDRQAQTSMGRVLPIEKVFPLLEKSRSDSRHLLWKGIPEYVYEARLEKARQIALKGDPAKARAMISELLEAYPDPNLYKWAAVIRANGASPGKKEKALFETALSMNPDNDFIRFLLYRCDTLNGVAADKRRFATHLKNLDWRSPQEVLGYLVKIIEGKVPVETAVRTGEYPQETAYLYWTAALVAQMNADADSYARYLNQARHFAQFDPLLEYMINTEMRRAGIRPETVSRQSTGTMEDVRQRLSDLLYPDQVSKQVSQDSAPDDARQQLMMAVFEYTAKGAWEKASKKARQYLSTPGRESANRLAMSLLNCQLTYFTGRTDHADAMTHDFIEQTQDPWYSHIAQNVLSRHPFPGQNLNVGNSREKILTLKVALGLKAEAQGNREKAVEYYNDALDTGLINWLEFRLAAARRDKIRQNRQ